MRFRRPEVDPVGLSMRRVRPTVDPRGIQKGVGVGEKGVGKKRGSLWSGLTRNASTVVSRRHVTAASGVRRSGAEQTGTRLNKSSFSGSRLNESGLNGSVLSRRWSGSRSRSRLYRSFRTRIRGLAAIHTVRKEVLVAKDGRHGNQGRVLAVSCLVTGEFEHSARNRGNAKTQTLLLVRCDSQKLRLHFQVAGCLLKFASAQFGSCVRFGGWVQFQNCGGSSSLGPVENALFQSSIEGTDWSEKAN